MASDTFWSNPKLTTPAVSMLEPTTTGDGRAPFQHIPGTLAGAIPQAYTTAAQAVYPWAYDPNEAVPAFNESTFPSWHSRLQINYLAKNGDVTIPVGSASPQAYYTVNSDKTAVINVMSLTVSDYQRLSAADRQKLEGIDLFKNTVAATLGLTLDRTGVNTTLSKIRNGENGNASALSTLPSADQAVFEKQLQLIERRMATSPRIAEGTIQTQLAEIGTRIARAAAFASVKAEVDLTVRFLGVDGVEKKDGTYVGYEKERPYIAEFRTEARGRVISSDGNATVTSGYASFMRLEREILTAQLRREALSRQNTYYDPKNDVAQLIYQLQLLYQTEASSVSDAGTEEMSQLHRLLADYAVIQRLVNETLKAFNPKNQEEKRRFLNLGGKADGVDGTQMISTVDNSQDTRVEYTWDVVNNRSEYFGYGDRGTTGFDKAPRYHWYLLGGTLTQPLISTNQLFRMDEEGQNLLPAGNITDRYSAYDQQDVVVKTGGLTKEEMRIVSMFSKDAWASGTYPQTHPIEQLYGVTRATSNLSSEAAADAGSLRLERRDYWDKWSTQLSDNVTLLNQKNQLKQNEIENASKEANRHFDLGTNALKKMNEMLMAIGRM